ncbi:FG-GAP-like repeat-containing protein [Flagellimonas onchidii]|uniref:FG-GAP-like repeat-containing protein n=1 Tax=Flagellimonas onchidii TaxID=2562684 RepID=UPI00145606EC|nr:FG-GAP-like repeat-containing protein [Allomuricauda onchidii]
MVCLLTIIGLNTVNAQTFERIEHIAGFGQLKENNGVAVADIDNDTDMDIFVVANDKDEDGNVKTYSKLFRNDNNGSFTDITESSGLVDLYKNESAIAASLQGFIDFKYGAFWGDYNNDGWQDIFFTHKFEVQLFKNQGDNTFVEVTTEAGIEKSTECFNTAATWTDYNNDGFLDLYVNEWGECASEFLYKNNGNETFTRINVGNDNLDKSFNTLPFDFNNDGYKDFYISVDLSQPNFLYINQQDDTFTESAAVYGVDSQLDDMGISMADFNNDGAMDMFITGIDENALLENQGDNTFVNVNEKYNISGTGWSWGPRFADYDLDGDEDLFIANGFLFRSPENNVYYKNMLVEGGQGFVDFSAETKLNDASKSFEAIEFDYDNDGDLDIFVSCFNGHPFFYKNTLIDENDSKDYQWIKVALEGTTSNRNAYGTTVSITTANGTFKKYFSGIGMISQSIVPLHFGLNGATTIKEIKIEWPSGLVETYQDIPSRMLLKAREGNGYELIDQVPAQKILGCTDPNSCNYNPLATLNDDSCQYLAPTEIQGPANTSFNNEERYRYNGGDRSEISWSVEGGEVISGENTNEILVRWGLEAGGSVTVIEKGGTCQSLPIELEVDIKIETNDDLSAARIWNEALLEAIRKDFARPTVHARNLFHTSIAMFDTWAIFDTDAHPYLLGNTVNGHTSEFDGFDTENATDEDIKTAISYAAYTLLSYRFKDSPGHEVSQERFDLIMEELGYDTNFDSTDYKEGNFAALGNYIAQTVIAYGAQDGSRESTGFDNAHYAPVNSPLDLNRNANADITITDPNRWQPLAFSVFIDQSGNEVEVTTPEFLSPEWGDVHSFALTQESAITRQRDGNNYTIFHDPGAPPKLSTTDSNAESDLYKWNFSLVSVWSAHLDPNDGVMWDISPNTIGNIPLESLPESLDQHRQFYDLLDGGDIGQGYSVNPRTNQPYETQIVPRADYARVLAEFWADGPDSETPPGHWFTILNYVTDHPQFIRKFNSEGEELELLEWDVKSYFVLGGAMHDAAISAWSIKGWYDYIRPISAIRYMASLGQSTDPEESNYHIGGIPLIEGYIEIVKASDPLAGNNDEHVGKIKLYAWKGHDFIDNPATDAAGVGWILAENWWPYQRPSFVTPPFAGYVSGHSTYSRAAAEVMTLITGDEYFPGGIGEFVAKKDEFLVFEEGPSMDVILQWATYRDASDQCSLSRIWGGIHPPADDINGRLIGERIGLEAYEKALTYFNNSVEDSNDDQKEVTKTILYPNPVSQGELITIQTVDSMDGEIRAFDLTGREIPVLVESEESNKISFRLLTSGNTGLYLVKMDDRTFKIIGN